MSLIQDENRWMEEQSRDMESGLSQVPARCDCSASDRANHEWERWFDEQTKGSDEWTSLERILARDAWMSALRWSGYFEQQESAKMPNAQANASERSGDSVERLVGREARQ